MIKSSLHDLREYFTLQEFHALPLAEQSQKRFFPSSTSTRREAFIMLGLAGLSLWQRYRIGFGDIIVIVSLYYTDIINSFSSCLVVQLAFTCLLVVVK